MSELGIARNVTLDCRSGDVWIDDHRLGAAVHADWSIDDLGGLFGVTLTILTDSAQVYHQLGDDLTWIRVLANSHRRDLGLPTTTPPPATPATRED